MTGALRSDGVRHLDEADATRLGEVLREALPWTVTAVEERPATQRPAPPFTTSTLQQEANRKLGFSADRTMSAAQRLFAEGVISYHRTDSTMLSDRALSEACTAIRDLVRQRFGGHAPVTAHKTRQERPGGARGHSADSTSPGPAARGVRAWAMTSDASTSSVWKRAVASPDGRCASSTASWRSRARRSGRAESASRPRRAARFAGFLRAYVEGTDDPAAELGDKETLLPRYAVGDQVTLDAGDWPSTCATSRATRRCRRRDTPMRPSSSASRRTGSAGPATYASIISTIERRGYVWREGKALVPTFTAYAVNGFLIEHFATLVELGFTGRSRRISTRSQGRARPRRLPRQVLQRGSRRTGRA